MHPLPNAVMTVIMGILFLYWLFAFISGAGFEGLDIDVDADIDVDVPDVDTDVYAGTEIDGPDTAVDSSDTDAHIDKEPGFFMKFLNFLNVGKVPFMLILSAFKFFLWVGSLITTSLVNVTGWGLWSLLILLPLAFVSLFFTKLSTNPLVKIFKELGYKGEEEIDFIGRSGKMLSSIRDKKIGTAEVIVDKNPMKLNVVSIDGQELKYGEYIIVADESEDKKIYYVSKEMSIRNF